MKRASSSSRTIPTCSSATGTSAPKTTTARVSFECDQRPDMYRHQQKRPSPTSTKSVRNNNVSALSSSAPSTFAYTYTPFSTFEDDDAIPRTTTNARTATSTANVVPNLVSSSLSDDNNVYGKALAQRALNNQQHQQLHQGRHENDDVMAVVQTQTEFPPVQSQREQEPNQGCKIVGTSFNASESTTSFSKTTTTWSSTGSTDALLESSPISIASTASATAASRTPGPPSSAPASTTHARAKPSSFTVTTGTTREQRRYSSEDGLVSSSATTRYSLPLPLSLSPNNGQRESLEEVFVIPSKCRMVFHMRDEVSKVKGPTATEEDMTGLGEKKGYRPQQQPRQYTSQSRQQPHQQQPTQRYSQQPTPLKKSSSTKAAKSVSFREPEPWRGESAESDMALTAATTTTTSIVTTIVNSAPVIVSSENTTKSPTATQSSDQQQLEQQQAAGNSSLPAAGLSVAPTIMFTRPSMECNTGHSTSSAPPTTAYVRTQSCLSATAAPSPLVKSATTLSRPAQRQGHHQRNMSAPSISALQASSASASASGVPRSMQTGGGQVSAQAGVKVPGNRFSRLWKSVAYKYGHHSQHHGGAVRPEHVAVNSVMVGSRGRGSDLEPLVALARD